jgi:winged helix DNA-binding protein
LTWAQVHAFRLGRHHLLKRAPTRDLARAVGAIGGAQAQLMSAAELQVATRVDCTVGDVRHALWAERSLVKTWLMRGTLHLTPAEDLPLFTAAMSRRWITPNKAWLRFFNVTEDEVWTLADEIGAALSDEPMTREELIAVVGKDRPARVREALKSGWGGMLKPAARNGRLCFGPNRGQSVTFVSPQRWLRAWKKVDPEVAVAEAARRYLRAYGPATKTDFARWWGAWPGVGNAAWSALQGELIPVAVDGARMEMLAADVDALREAAATTSVTLLAQFDPFLLGHANRDHLFDRVHASRISRTAGWISAVVLVGGRVAGTWTHKSARDAVRVTVTPFEPLRDQVKKAVRSRADALALAMGARGAEVDFA